MSGLPASWKLRRLGELCELNPRDDAPADPNTSVSFIPMPAVSEVAGAIVPHAAKPFSEVSRGYTRFRTGDVIFAKITPCMENGKVAIAKNLINDRACGSTEFHVIRPRDEIIADYVWRYLRQSSFRQRAEMHMTGAVGQRRVPAQFLRDVEVPTPPVSEQRRILAKLESLFARSESAREELDRVPRLVERYKQAVLAAAFRGQLTQRAGQLPAGGEIPKTWKWSKLKALCEAIVDCPHTTPKWEGTGEICLRTSDFRPGRLDLSQVRYVSPDTYKHRIARLTPQSNDIVYSREGGILGIACQIPPNVRVCLGQRMMLMRTVRDLYNPSLLMHFLNSPVTTSRVRDLTGGTASPHLNVGDVKNFDVPVPPRDEQDKIVSAITTRMVAIAAAYQQSDRARILLGRFEGETLSKAFAGTLTPNSFVGTEE